MVDPIRYDPGALARSKRPANVRATDSAAPEEYSSLPAPPPGSDIYTHLSHAAQYGAGRRYGIGIRCLILHTTEGTNFLSSINYNTWRPETVSSTAHAGPAGELAYEIDEANRPWTTGRWNDESLTLEIVGKASWSATDWRARPAQIEAITRWIVDGCRRHNIPPIWLTPAEFAEGASRAGEPLRAGTRRGVIDHWGANQAAISLGHSASKYSHWDIGPGLREVVLDDVMPEVRRRLNPPVVPPVIGGSDMEYVPLAVDDTCRVLDQQVGAGKQVTVHAYKAGGDLFPAAAKAVAVHITADKNTAAGFVTAWPSGQRPNVSCLNYSAPGDTRNGLTIVPLSGFGTFELFTLAGARMVVDVIGAFVEA